MVNEMACERVDWIQLALVRDHLNVRFLKIMPELV
jgi:hypothetical protein